MAFLEVDEDPCVGEEVVELNSSTESSDSNSTIICRPSKVLLVTVPTPFTEQIDDELGEDIDVVDDEEEDDDDETYEITNVDIADNDSQPDSTNDDLQEVVIEDLTEIGEHDVQPVIAPLIHQHHKPVLTKNARVEEDSDNEIDLLPRPNSPSNLFEFSSESVENLIDNFQECTISIKLEDESFEEKPMKKYKDVEDEEDIFDKITKMPTLSPQDSLKTNENQIVKQEEKKSRNFKNKSLLPKTTSVPLNIRAQCPIFRRNYTSQSTPKKDVRSKSFENRPSTAPTKRHCCNYWNQDKLPEYNGLRSEYGLTAEQLLQRKRDKFEFTKSLRLVKERKYLEEIRRQKENEQIFQSWLVKKKKEAAQKFSRKKLHSTFHFKTVTAPTKHLDKVGALRKKLLKKEHTSYSLEEFFKNANPHEQKTYRIYLGLCIE